MNLVLLSNLLKFFIEWSSILDLFSDFVIIKGLGQSIHTAWFAISLITVIAPYLTVYTSLISYQIDYMRRQDATTLSIGSYFLRSLFILPTMILLLLVIDFVYMII